MPMTESEKIAYVEDHLPYERMMLEYSYRRLSSGPTQLDWNAFYESFAIHARNLYALLTNDDDVRAIDFAAGFSTKKSDETKRIFPKLLAQVFHLNQKRPSEPEKKIAQGEAAEFYEWLAAHFARFVGSLNETYVPHWHPDRAVPPPGSYDVAPKTSGILHISTGGDAPAFITIGDAPPSTSANPTFPKNKK